ncbi:hypothetical protein KR009_002136, partial [Drosophila setifemur]
MARLSALGIAVMLHSVLGISYYYYFRSSPPAAPLLGSWLFSACVVFLLQAIKIFPSPAAVVPTSYEQARAAYLARSRGGGGGGLPTTNQSSWAALLLEAVICCLVLDVALTKLWRRVESLCQCAIVGVLQALSLEEQTFLACEYWTLGITTGLIGACLLWLTIWATALPQKLQCGLLNLQRQLQHRWSSFIYGKDSESAPVTPGTHGTHGSKKT